MGQRLDLGKQALWLKLVQRCQRSRLSVRDFCQQHEVSESNFYAWRRVLRERGLIDERAQLVETGTPAFVKLTLDAEQTPASTVEVVLGCH